MEAAAAKLKSEIHVPSLAARELRALFRDALLQRPDRGASPCPAQKEIRRDEPQQLPKSSDEGSQTVRRRHARRAEAKKASRESLLQQERRPPFLEKQSDACRARYLRKVEGRCFNCFARDHRIADCRDPIKCWRCHCSGHISTRCLSLHRPAPVAQLGHKARS
jgi:hypothetical protein